MDDSPDVSDEEPGGEELGEANGEGVALELFAGASGDHGSERGSEWNAVEDQANEGEGWVELDHGLLAASNSFVSFSHLFKQTK